MTLATTRQQALATSRVERLATVDGVLVYDIPGAPVSGGGTRLAADVTEYETRLLARAMTYKLAALELRVGGAKIGLRAPSHRRDEAIARFRSEIAERLRSGALMTGPDLGTTEEDFAGLPTPGGAEGIASRAHNGVPAEELLTGEGVAAAIAAALGGELEGRTVAIEGFGKMGASIARALDRRGARIAAVSTAVGCAIARLNAPFAPAELLEARDRWGDRLVRHLGVLPRPTAALWSVGCDALVPGARPGVLDAGRAARIAATAVVPVANAPYTAGGLRILEARGVAAHADFVASAGGAMAYLGPQVARAESVEAAASAIDEIMGSLVTETMGAGEGPYAGAVALAERFLGGWVPAAELPDGPPVVD